MIASIDGRIDYLMTEKMMIQTIIKIQSKLLEHRFILTER